MTSNEAADDLLGLIGIESVEHAPAQLQTRILGDLNKTLTDIYAFAPQFWDAEFAPIEALDTTAIDLDDRYIYSVFLPFLRANFATYKAVDKETRDGLYEDRKMAWDTLKLQINKSEVDVVSDGTLTVMRAALDLVGLVGLSNVQAASASLKSRILTDINATMQKIWTKAGKWWSEERVSAEVQAPTPITGLTLTHGSKTISGTVAAWMIGCTVQLSGDAFQNQFVNATTLLNPHNGPSATGTGAGIVYCDAITLAPDVAAVLAPVELLGECELAPMSGQREVKSRGQSAGDNRDINTPTGYYIERYLVSGRVTLRIRLSPLPDRYYVIQYGQRYESPRVTAINSDPLRVPQQYIESIFIPILRQQFSTWPEYKLQGNSTNLRDERDAALLLLDSLNPQPSRRGRVVRPKGW